MVSFITLIIHTIETGVALDDVMDGLMSVAPLLAKISYLNLHRPRHPNWVYIIRICLIRYLKMTNVDVKTPISFPLMVIWSANKNG